MSSSSRILNCLPVPHPVRASASASTSQTICCFGRLPSNSLSFRIQHPRHLHGKAGLASRASSIRKLSITCGAVTEISEAQFPDLVLKSDRPVLVEFVAGWCGPCRLISPAVESVAQEYKDKLLVVKIDHDANPRLIEEYKVYGLPALILFKNGQEVPESRREGAITKAKLKEYVETLLE